MLPGDYYAIDKSVQLVEIYKQSEEYRRVRERIDPVLKNVVEETKRESMAQKAIRKMFTRELYATSFLWQVCI